MSILHISMIHMSSYYIGDQNIPHRIRIEVDVVNYCGEVQVDKADICTATSAISLG